MKRAALREAVMAWRRTLAPVIADAVVALDRQLAFEARLPPRRAEFQRGWVELVADAPIEAVGYLCRTLTRCLQGPETLIDRVGRLARLPADPRIAEALTEIVVRGPLGAWGPDEARSIYGPMLALIAVSGDVRQLEPLREAQKNPRSPSRTAREYLVGALPSHVERLGQIVPADLPESELATWRALVAPEPLREERTDAELLKAVRDEPAEDGPRLVYADWLEARGDPRGELIQLQIAGASDETDKRVRALLRQHKEEWLGPDLACVLARPRFERGFLASAELEQNSVAEEAVWQRAARDPALATLERIGLGRSNLRHYQAFLEGGALTALDTADVPAPAILKKLLTLPIRERLRRLDLWKLPPPRVLTQLPSAFPSLDTLTLRLDFVADAHGHSAREALAASGVLPKLSALALFGLRSPEDVRASWAALPANVQRLLFGWAGSGHHELRRGADGKLVLRLFVEDRSLVAFITDLATDLVAVELVGGSDAEVLPFVRAAESCGIHVERVSLEVARRRQATD